MTGKRFITRLFMLGVITLAGMSSAFAGGTLNNPRGAWSVGPINAVSSSGVGFCSMKNVYDDGKALVFARDAEGSNSIAVSFTEKKFMTSGAQYQVNLEADNLKRTMVALAATPTVLIVQMGLDRDFYTILRKKNVLNIGVRDKQYSFSLSGTAEALDALTKCAQDVAAGKVYKQTEVAVAPVQGPFAPAAANPNAIIPGVPVMAMPTLENSMPGKQAADTTLRYEIERLKLENRRLMAENMAATQRAIAADRGHHTAADTQMEAALEAQRQSLLLAEEEQAAPKPAKAPAVIPVASAPLAAPVAATPVKAEEAADDKVDMGILLAAEPAAGDSTPPAQPVAPFLYSLLVKSGVTPTVQGLGYVWLTNNIYGAAEERQVPQGRGLRDSASDYVSQAAARCKGDFAHKEASPVKLGQLMAIESEVACLDGKNDAAAALLFVEEKGKIAIITHEGMADQMETALSQRDAVKSAISR
ncbi:MAG: hypothetical protein PW788_08760 [Micavibrio sp.]|nr:hypothetical protein [Micavibrio sp.]